MNNLSEILRWIITILGGVLAILEPTLPYIAICTLAIFYDCFTAWQLARRVHKAYPDRTKPHAHKFTSSNFGRVLLTLLKSWALIVLAYLIQRHITNELPIDMTKVAAGAICFWQLWSILENESSCNGARWAKIAQRILIDKTTRHFDIDLSGMTGTHGRGRSIEG